MTDSQFKSIYGVLIGIYVSILVLMVFVIFLTFK